MREIEKEKEKQTQRTNKTHSQPVLTAYFIHVYGVYKQYSTQRASERARESAVYCTECRVFVFEPNIPSKSMR